ncbi:MAG: SpoIIIAH-like family protein [Clostridia bacterium]|nr:SpoIIIAH-like family protein [Clostridia bacterium]
MNKNRQLTRPWGKWLRRGMLLVLAAACAVLWLMEGNDSSDNNLPSEPVPTAYTDERLKRENAYERDITALQALVNNESADAATREMAAQQLAVLIAEHQSEIQLETALLEAGYRTAIVLVNNGAVTVMVPQDQLTEEKSAQILALCLAHTDADAENVRVMANRQQTAP